MKNNIAEFIRRGLTACGFGPLVLAVVYLILKHQGVIDVLTINQVCLGIFSLAALAFITGGMNIIYKIERLSLTLAILIHGLVLYVSYLVTYLVNGWLESGITPILVYTGIFVFAYLVIWLIIFFVTKRRTDKLNKILKEKQQVFEMN